jgi:hypothetical protein
MYIFVSTNQTDMIKATYTNKATKETYSISGENITLEKAWGGLLEMACRRMSWNYEMACEDLKISVNEKH